VNGKKAKQIRRKIYGDYVSSQKGRKYAHITSKGDIQPLHEDEIGSMMFKYGNIIADDKRRAYKAAKRAA